MLSRVLSPLNVNPLRATEYYNCFQITIESPERPDGMRFESKLPKAWSSKSLYDALVTPALVEYYAREPAKRRFRAKDIRLSANGVPLDGTKPLSSFSTNAANLEVRLAFPGVAAFSPRGTYVPPTL